MVVNKNDLKAPGDDQEKLRQQVTLAFTADVHAIQRLNRDTGKVEKLELADHAFSFKLPGGTGDLFKYASEMPFAGDE